MLFINLCLVCVSFFQTLHKSYFKILPISNSEILHRIIHGNRKEILEEIDTGTKITTCNTAPII